MTKKKRQEVFEKFGGLCAYSGKPLDDKWQVDHARPKTSWYWQQPTTTENVDHISNLLPAIRIVNHYKRSHNLETFRQLLLTLHLRLKKLPKNTSVPKSIRHKEYLLEVAALFGISVEQPFDGIFYFERIATVTSLNKQ